MVVSEFETTHTASNQELANKISLMFRNTFWPIVKSVILLEGSKLRKVYDLRFVKNDFPTIFKQFIGVDTDKGFILDNKEIFFYRFLTKFDFIVNTKFGKFFLSGTPDCGGIAAIKEIFVDKIWDIAEALKSINVRKYKRVIINDFGAHFGFAGISLVEQLRVMGINNENIYYFAYEPSKKNFEVLKKNIDLRLHDLKHYYLKNLAIGSKNSKMGFLENQFSSEGGRVAELSDLKDVINAINLKKVYNKLFKLISSDTLNIAKFDIEGFEYEVFKTGKHFLKKQDIILIEFHERLVTGSEQYCRNILLSLGFIELQNKNNHTVWVRK